MVEKRTPSAQRSKIMRAIQSKDTKPENIVRGLIKELGYKFSQHYKNLPGKPDFCFSVLRKVIFVHGCFWHAHHCKRGARMPKTNADYWFKKITSNKLRDKRTKRALSKLGWKSLVIWECQLKNQKKVSEKIHKFLCKND